MQPPLDTIICGDNVTVMSEWPDGCIDLTVTSPPYDNWDGEKTHAGQLRKYQGYSWDFPAVAQQLYRVTKPGGVVVWVVGDATINGSETGSSFRQALGFMERGFNLHDTMIYERPGQYPDTARYYSSFEYMFVFSKGVPRVINLIADKKNIYAGERISGTDRNSDGTLRKASGARNGRTYKEYGVRYNIWKYATGLGGNGDTVSHEHPASFPEALAHDHIISWSNPGDIVLDPFVGSGTTPKMAAVTDRHYIGIDVSPEYCELAERRIAAVKQQPKLFSWDLQPAVNRQ